MSQEFWDSFSPEEGTTDSAPQTVDAQPVTAQPVTPQPVSAQPLSPQSLTSQSGMAQDSAPPMTRREARERQQRDDAAAIVVAPVHMTRKEARAAELKAAQAAEVQPDQVLADQMLVDEASIDLAPADLAQADPTPTDLVQVALPQAVFAPADFALADFASSEVVESDVVMAEPALSGRKKARGAKPGRAQSRRAKARLVKAGRNHPSVHRTSVPPVSAPKRKGSLRSAITKFMTFGAMAGVGAMLVATSVPANAFFFESDEIAAGASTLQTASETVDGGVQAVTIAESDAVAQVAERDTYTVVSLSEQLRKIYGERVYSFTNNPDGTVQWPFYTSPISSGFGARVACSYCSSNHLGLDFVPGAGTPISAIADGVVTEVSPGGGPYGVFVVIAHEFDGKKVESLYAHMRWGSSVVAVGQTVKVGDALGEVGSSGASTGPHLHFEIHIDGVAIDPYDWLKANAN